MEKKMIKFRVSEAEHDMIGLQAAAAGMKVNGYCRSIVLNKKPEKKKEANFDLYQAVMNHTEEIMALREQVEGLINRELDNKIMFRNEIRRIENTVYEIENKEAELLRLLRTYRESELYGNDNSQ